MIEINNIYFVLRNRIKVILIFILIKELKKLRKLIMQLFNMILIQIKSKKRKF